MSSFRLRWIAFLSATASAGALVLMLVLALAGCTSHPPFDPVPLQRPVIEPTFSPNLQDSVQYVVTLHWSASDADGQVVGFRYAIDPPAEPTPGVDTAWVDTQLSTATLNFPSRTPRDPLPIGSNLPSSDYHTIVLIAIDNDGLRSEPVARSFTTFTIAPWSVITVPNGTDGLGIGTTPSLTIEWIGDDPDGTTRPVKYKYKLVTAAEILPSDPGAVTGGVIQDYFSSFATDLFASWDSVGGDTTSKFVEGLTPGVHHYFAVVAFDEAGAYEPRFNRNTNVLWFVPSLDRLGPKIRIWNEFLSHLQQVGGVNPYATSRWVRVQFPADAAIVFNWSAEPPRAGTLITGYRWAVDLEDIGDETPREDDFDVRRWSRWSLEETSARVGPFTAAAGEPAKHFFQLEARDNLGFVSLLTVELTIVRPTFDQSVLLVDDLYGAPTQAVRFDEPDGPVRLPARSFPIEAEQDTFYVARGGFPDQLYERAGFPGVTSRPGIFSEYVRVPSDTVDYRFWPDDGINLEKLSHYQAVCWYTDNASAARDGRRFGSTSPMTALRAINTVSHLNTLAVYARQGGHVWLFGEGATTAIGNGFYSRIGGIPPLPYRSGEEPGASLVPGNFLHDFCHLRSELSLGGSSTFRATQLASCLPYLPEFRGPATAADRTHDPRVGGGAERTALRWAGLPRLTIGGYREAPAGHSLASTWVISEPNFITSGPPHYEPRVDTLYLHQAREYDPHHVYEPYETDGYPNAIHYHGDDNGPGSQLVWFGFPLHYFDQEQARQVVREVMRNFGIQPLAPVPTARLSSRSRAGR
jgi:hypothetical protein